MAGGHNVYRSVIIRQGTKGNLKLLSDEYVWETS